MERVFVASLALLATVAVLVVPVLANRRFRRSRRPTEAEAERIDAFCTWGELDVDEVYVIETVGEDSVDVAVRGPPGRRFLFVTDYVLEELDDAVAAALFAAEGGRTRAYYGLVRAVSVGIVIGMLGATFALIVPFGPGFAGIAAFGLVALWTGRQLQYLADEKAATVVGRDELADAYERVADLKGVEPERGSWTTVFDVQPPLGDRIDRLRAKGEESSN